MTRNRVAQILAFIGVLCAEEKGAASTTDAGITFKIIVYQNDNDINKSHLPEKLVEIKRNQVGGGKLMGVPRHMTNRLLSLDVLGPYLVLLGILSSRTWGRECDFIRWELTQGVIKVQLYARGNSLTPGNEIVERFFYWGKYL
jgi:hypothetical protein